MAHAQARDAVHEELDAAALKAALASVEVPVINLSSMAADRQTYLQRPDLGRCVDEASRKVMGRVSLLSNPDLCLILSDGLSATAAQRQGPALLAALVPLLNESGVSLSPLFVVRNGRVEIEDEIGAAVGAKAALILIGERPGLGSPDSLGAYLVFEPRAGRTDAERNCVSNIRPAGLEIPAAAATLNYLVKECLRRKLSGVGLKDERGALGPAAGASPGQIGS